MVAQVISIQYNKTCDDRVYPQESVVLSSSNLNLYCFVLLFRRATRLALAASLIFLVLMVPRAISILVSIIGDPERKIGYINDTHTIIDLVTYWLQYLNHSVNFFVYIVANKNFRLKYKWFKLC